VNAALARVWDALLSEWAPPEDFAPSEWAERHIVVPDGERAGPMRFDRGYEYQREVMDAFFGPFGPGEMRRQGCAYKGAQSGITLLCQAGALYWVAHRRVSTFHMMPRQFDADDKAKRLADIIDADPLLTERFPSGLLRVRKSTSGQSLRIPYSNSTAELKNWQSGIGIIDELDECEFRDYDSVAMALQRMGSYRRTIEIYIGTPTIPDFGIHAIYESSDQRQWIIECPLCQKTMPYTWDGMMRWDAAMATDEDRSASARMVCALCEKTWDFRLREIANSRGRWIARSPKSKIIGFDMNRLMVPTSLPSKMVGDYLLGLKSDGAMREHVNQNLGEVYLPSTGKLDSRVVEAAIDPALRWGEVPRGTVQLSAGIDVQGEAEPFDLFWELRAFNQDGHATVVAYGIAKEAAILELFGCEGRMGRYHILRGLVDISDGHHKEAVERLCKACSALQPARFDWHRQTSFDRGKVVKVKSGHSGFALDRDDALQDNLGRFFESAERGRRISIAPCPDRALEKAWVEHYTKIARVKEDGPRGPVYTYRKLRQRDVDFPFAGALAEYVFRHLGAVLPGSGNFGSVAQVREKAGAQGREAARSALRIVGKGRPRR
jgi:hypothetical protein